jgi:hypothetical protein
LFKKRKKASYCLFNQSLTISGAITDSTKVYAPDLGDLTILMALVNLLDDD